MIYKHNLTAVVEFAHIFEIIHGCFTSYSTVIDMKTATKRGHTFVKSSKLGLCHVLCYWLVNFYQKLLPHNKSVFSAIYTIVVFTGREKKRLWNGYKME